MTKEDKELLLKDLCARLPYGIKVNIRNWDCPTVVQAVYSDLDILVKDMCRYSLLGECSPYLRPMLSMTHDEDVEYRDIMESGHYDSPSQKYASIIDWLNEHHFDYRGLIRKDLALEAPEGMYKTE